MRPSMTAPKSAMNRRRFLSSGAGLLALAGTARRADAADLSQAERANVEVVNQFCAAWPSRDTAKVMAFFDDACAYRMTETAEPAKGREAVTARVKTIIDRVERFEVLDTFARGPMVVNERIDRFSSGTLK